jgi:transposase
MKEEQRVTQLEAENANLQHQLERALKRISELEGELTAEKANLAEQLQRALGRIEELEGRLSKNSHNSSKPPSSDGLGRKSHSQRKPSGRPSGGQSGHRGQTLALVETPDGITSHRPARCEQCGKSLQQTPGRVVERRQVHDLPPIQLVVQEHQGEEVCCPHCQWVNRGSFPAEVKATVQYGGEVRALAVYLNQYQLVPMERTCQIMSEGLGCPISEGTLANWNEQASKGLEATMEKIKQGLLICQLMHADETGIRIGKKLHWLHTASTRFLTYLQWHQKRGRSAMDDIGIWPEFQGRAMRDRLSSSDRYTCAQSICGSHLLRDLAGVYEQTGQKWAAEMNRVLVAMNKVAWYWRKQGATSLPKPMRDRWVARYFQTLISGFAAQPAPTAEHIPKRKGPAKQTPAKNLLDALLHRAHQVLAVLDDLRIPFTNNLAERDLRMAKVQQKIAGTFRSPNGATAFCRIRSYLSTMAKQGHAMLEALAAVFSGHPLPIAWTF